MKKLAVTLCVLCIVISKLYSIPSTPELIKFIQNDGSRLNMYQFGDEFIHWSETVDGYTILNDGNNLFYYAKKDRQDNLIRSDVQAHNINERDSNEGIFLRSLERHLRFSKNQIDQFRGIIYHRIERSRYGDFPTTGTNNLLMILVNYSDTDTTFIQTDFDNYMNQTNYNGTGSFRDYYIECSYGQLTVNTTVTNWVTASNTHDYYGQNDGSGYDLHPRELVYEAIQLVDASVNFADYDNDSNGEVDGIAVIHQGTGEETSGNANDIWSHSWALSGLYTSTQRTFDGVLVDDYTIQPEMSGSTMNTIGVMCHEFGHNMGAPDFYDTDYGTGGLYDGTGDWDIMASGSYNGTPSGSKPAHHNPFTKWKYYNWILPSEINSTISVSMNNSVNNTDFYYYTTTTPNEYFLLENRQQIGFDSGVPGHGLIIYHVDEDYINAHYFSNDINTTSHQGFYPKAANGTINSSGCPFPGTSNNTSFTDNTIPNSQSWANNDTNKPVTNISESSNIIYFDFMDGADQIDVALVLDRSGSMSGNKITQAKNASSQFVQLLSVGDEVAVCSYSSSASTNFPITEITGQQTIEDAVIAISGISSGGMTSIGAGMQDGQGQLYNCAIPNYNQGMLLLSDGWENTSPMVADILPTIPAETDIYTIGFGDGCDEALMGNIAAATGGFYRKAYDDGSNISAICHEILNAISGQQIIASFSGSIGGGGREVIEHNVVLDSLCSQVTFNLMWEHSDSDLDLVLIDPNNNVIDSAYAASDTTIYFYSYETQEFYRIDEPDYGDWTLRIIGVTVPYGTEDYDATVAGFSGIEMQVAFDQDSYVTGQPIVITSELTVNGIPITNAMVTAEIENPNYTTETIDLFDDGNHDDGVANDGIYGNSYNNTNQGGSYTFTVFASGTAPVGGDFTRIASRSTFVSGPTLYQTTIDAGWNMLAVPGIPSPSDPVSIFGDDIIPFYTYTNNSNIWWWSEINSSYWVPDEITNGYGYWLKAWEDNTVVDAAVSPIATPVTINLTNSANYYVMQHGYHMLGNPFNSSIVFGPENFDLDPAIVQNTWIWENDCYVVYPFTSIKTINPWQAFWIQTSQDDQNITMYLSIREEVFLTNDINNTQNNNRENTNWEVQFEVIIIDLHDISNYAGVNENASDGWDVMDAIELPPMNSDYISLYFPHDDWGPYSANYTRDVRNPALEENEWYFVVKSTESGEAQLTWNIPVEVPEDYQLEITDLENGNTINIKETSEYIFNVTANSEYEFVFTVVQCDFDISGNIGYFNDDDPVSNALLELTGDNTYSTTTVESGDYLFSDIPGGNYVSTPSKIDDLGGLSGTDASRIARYVALLYEFDCIEMITADVSMNQSISGTDASRVARYVALLITDLNTDGIHWVFTPEPIPDCADWPPIVYENTREYFPLESDLTDEDFIGIRLGDVSGNWSQEVRESLTYAPSEVTNIETDINSTLRIPVVIEEATAIEGIDICIEFDPEVLQITELTLKEGILDNKNYAIETNLNEAGKGIMVIYAQKDLVSESGIVASIEFDVIGEVGSQSEVYFTKFDINETEASGGLQVVDSEGNEIVTTRLQATVIESIPEKFAFYQNYPNPFSISTMIKYQLPERTDINISIYNIKGQKVRTLINIEKSAGYYNVCWDGNNDYGVKVNNGIYFYRFETEKFQETKKMLFIR